MEADTGAGPLVGITMGDPGGIGPEIIVKGYPGVLDHGRAVVIGDATVLRRAIEVCDVDRQVRPVDDPNAADTTPETVDVLDLANVDSHAWGERSAAAGDASLAYIERAIALAQAAEIDAIVTAPINKQAIRLAGSDHAGHTGLLAERTGTDTYAMLLVDGPLRVSHVSTHVPLGRACELVTADRVKDTIQLTAEGLNEVGVTEPQIAVAGLNPHAGDGGLLGKTDEAEIAPAVDAARTAGIDVTGPVAPDTVFRRVATGAFDGVVAMYHDQGHIAVKTFGAADGAPVSGVNVTLGLPLVRTSVDHGTAFDIAGTGVASPTSLIQAVDLAGTIADHRRAA